MLVVRGGMEMVRHRVVRDVFDDDDDDDEEEEEEEGVENLLRG